jgi:hypothetical protein
MARGRIGIVLTTAFALALAALVGCSKTPTTKPPPLQNPETELTFAPLQGDTASYRIHFYWNGYDNDGEVTQFRYALDADTLKPPSQWISTTAKDTTLLFLVDPVKEVQGHVFWVVAEDNDGHFDPTPAKRFFSAKTVPPVSRITRGPNAPGTIIGPNFTFEWEGVDPDGGETGGSAPVDSFEYLLLQDGAQLDTDHPPLKLPAARADWVKLIVNSTGPSLPAPFDNWKWTGIRAKRKRFQNVTPGYYVFAIRAVDIAGATEKLTLTQTPTINGISWSIPALPPSDPRNIRDFNVTNRNPGPTLTVSSSVLVNPLPSTSGPTDIVRPEIQIFEGETISFSWFATGEVYGGEIVGYTSALDDTTTAEWGSIDLTSTSVTLTNLSVGPHFLFVRAVDDGGLVTNMKVPLRIVHPAFKDPVVGRPQVLYVDDFAAPPGDWASAVRGSPDYPKDFAPWQGTSDFPAGSQEDQWWSSNILVKLSQEFGVEITHDDVHDTVFGTLSGRDAPLRSVFPPSELAKYRTVIWYVDFNNTISSPTALWRTLVGGSYSELAGYLRAGGTLVLTGFQIASQVSKIADTPFTTRGMCATIDEGSANFKGSYFVRDFMGLDGAVASDVASRAQGAKDFIEARPTLKGTQLGFVTAQVDVGNSTAKWDSMAFNPTTFPDTRDTRLAPGLPKVEGWILNTANFGCFDQSVIIRKENSDPVVSTVMTYHGVPKGVRYDGGPSPREGMAVAIASQAHDLGASSDIERGRPITVVDKGVIGRMVILGFPIYYIKDAQVYDVMRAAFAYVNASPTLPTYSP